MRPSTADILASQLEQTSRMYKAMSEEAKPLSLSANGPPSSTFSLAPSPSSYTSSISPLTPATPWSQHSSSTNLASQRKDDAYRGNETGLGLSVGSPGPAKLAARGGLSKARADTDEDELDDHSENELNDFGYGTRTKKKDKKESLLDMLNSEPPAWMSEVEPVPVSIPRRGSTLPSKIRRKFSSNAVDAEIQAGFTTLQKGGSAKDDTSPLRSSRSAGNLLNSFRARTSNFGFKLPGGGGGGGGNRSRPDLRGSVDLSPQTTLTSTPSPSGSNRPSTSSGIPRLSPTRMRFKRPSTAQTAVSEESAYDPQNKEAIQVDDSLMRGMFGVRPKSRQQVDEEEAKERLRDSQIGGPSPALGVYEFVAVDERDSGGKPPEPSRLGNLTKSKSLGNVSTARRISVVYPSQPSSITSSPTKLPSPRRKPVPLGPQARTSSTSSSVSLRPDPSQANLPGPDGRHRKSSLIRWESAEEGSLPKAVAPSSSSLPFSSLVPTPDVATPTTPYEMYSTPPLTPATPAHNKTRTTVVVSPTSNRPISLSTPADRVARSRTPSSEANFRSNHASAPPAPPSASLPQPPSSRPSSQASSRKDPFRPRPMVLQPSETVAKRLSAIILAPPIELNLEDSALFRDSSRSESVEPSRAASIDPLFDCLNTLRSCLSQTANLPLQSTSLDDLVPTLRGLQEGLNLGSKILSEVLARLDKGDEKVTEHEEAKLVGALLGEEFGSSTDDAEGRNGVPSPESGSTDGRSSSEGESSVSGSVAGR